MWIKRGMIVLLCTLGLSLNGFVFAENIDIGYLPGELVVKFKNTDASQDKIKLKSEDVLDVLSSNEDIHIKKNLDVLNMAILSVPRNIEMQSLISELESDPNVEYVEPNYIYKPLSLPNDQYYPDLRAFPFSHRDNALPIIMAKVPQNPSVIVAVIDVGVDYLHPDLIQNMWDGSNCLSNTGAYLGGCLGGYDFHERDKEPNALYSSHGTHVAGTIAAVMDNGIGVVGVNPYAKIMGIRAGIDNAIYTTSAIEGVSFAIQNGAKVINASFLGAVYSQSMYDAIRIFGEHGGLFVAGAGNDGKNHATTHGYPCDYDLDNLICVGSVSSSNSLSYFSDWGSGYIDILAPGESIKSTTFSVQLLGSVETFSGLNEGELPAGWIKTGTGNTRGAKWDTGLNSHALSMFQSGSGYTANADFGLIKSEDMSNILSGGLFMDISCDTEYNTHYWKDYLTVSFSSDGIHFDEIEKIDEGRIDVKKQYPADGEGVSLVRGYRREIPARYRTSNFALKLGWISNDLDNDHKGCSVDNIKISKDVISSHSYWTMQGTSMSTPHVAGLVSLVRGIQPDLTYSEVKNIIFENSDYITGLESRIGTSSKININKTLSALNSGMNLSYVSLSSNNISPNYAISGDTITLSFSGDALSGLTEVYVNGNLVESTGNADLRTANYSVTGGTLNSNVLFEIHYIDRLGHEVIMTTTTDASQIIVDTIAPSFTITNPILSVTGASITINLTGFDTNGMTGVSLNTILLSGANARNTSVSLLPGVNPIVVTGSDYAGNSTTVSIDITRIPYTYSGIYTIIDANTVKIHFNSDFVTSGFVRYGTGGLTDYVSSGEATNHTLLLSNLVPNTTYTYQTYGVYQGSTGTYSASLSFKTPDIFDTKQGGIKTATGSIFLLGSSSTGVIFENTGSITIYSTVGDNDVAMVTSGLVISTSGNTWNGIINGPVQVSFTGITPIFANYKHIPALTFEIGSNQTSLTFTGTTGVVYPTINLGVGTVYNDKVLKIFRSDNGYPYGYISDCIVKNGVCTFTTTSFSLFTILAPDTTTTGGGGTNGLGGGGGGSSNTVEPITKPITTPVIVSSGGEAVISKLSEKEELKAAYVFAYKNKITTQSSIEKADMGGPLIREHLAKMISNYAINVLGKKVDTTKSCVFEDIGGETSEIRGYIKIACQLGLMGQNTTKFDPTGTVNRGQFSTILSRLLYGSQYEGGTPYYAKHITAVKTAGIIKSIDPSLKEIRGYVMLMLMRSQSTQ